MATVIVDVVLKPEILDAQGQAIQAALPRLGFTGVASVRQGKHFEIEIDGDLDEPALRAGTRPGGHVARQPGDRGVHRPRRDLPRQADRV